MQSLAPALFALTLSMLAVGCGGSSSETPPPLEPDPTSYRYTGPRVQSPPEEPVPAGESAAEEAEDDAPVRPKKPAATTWGSGKTPAPALSSEGAGQR